ncbi:MULTISPECIES: metal ABC transporter permease [Methylocaldum]|jgi:zinc transport system permease protein|uniref:metal ABC transporter permease n=1 Tax=Methylocaldum sp. RMAD-M TaxID=2806557 RepID=UPI000A322283|nr:metal ABC transporter permease [Methylocaldum sp. RMAD-M]MBP1150114.1 zinc transport system permease protein [Methylocaldum sp. RMAD-M]MVF24016.1 metal ABC transporter permease [Methylocaldum sp. BRCS4]
MSGKILLALILGGATGAVAGYLGSLMLSKRMALVGGALGHLTLPGIALALLYDFDVSIGAVLFLGFGVLLIWYLERVTRLHLEALTAVVFSTALATAFLFLPEEETDIALLGDVSRITATTAAISVAIALGIFFMVRHIYSNLVLIGISSDLAGAQGLDLRWHNAVYLICIALTVALGVRIVGGLMTAALLAIPACTARNVSRNLGQYAAISGAAGGLSALAGILAHATISVPPGPSIILASGFLFLGSVYLKVRRERADRI